jgi:hypothetical protein
MQGSYAILLCADRATARKAIRKNLGVQPDHDQQKSAVDLYELKAIEHGACPNKQI